jgi:hypothetical protein
MIKLFEEYNKYYVEIDVDYYREIIDEEDILLQFTECELDDISRFLNCENVNRNFIVKWFAIPTVEIFKLRDEWYYVWFDNKLSNLLNDVKAYRCDQFEGLLECLKMIKSKL